jgi:KipI family sensor histidine kinase inhibitor
MSGLRISAMGSGALLASAPGALDIPTQRRIWALAQAARGWPGVREAAPGMTNLLVTFDALLADPEALTARLHEAWAGDLESAGTGKVLELPVIYGGEKGPDLGLVAQRAGFSEEEAVRLHAASEYVVFAPGSSPGFGYLFGLDERLHTPRKNEPVIRKTAGMISIGGMQCSIGAVAGPSGWNAIGTLAKPVTPFDPFREPPVLVLPGDRIRFTIVAILS